MPLQRLLRPAQGVADSLGRVLLKFESVPESLVWTGTLMVSNAEASAVWVPYIGIPPGSAAGPYVGTVWGQWTGAGVGGPVQAWPRETLFVVGTGVTPGTIYTALWIGESIDDANAMPVSPAVFTPAVTGSQLAAAAIPAPIRLTLADVLFAGSAEIQGSTAAITPSTVIVAGNGTMSYAPAGADPLVAFFEFRLAGAPSGTLVTYMYQVLQSWDSGAAPTDTPNLANTPIEIPAAPVNVHELLGNTTDTTVNIRCRANNAAPFTLVGFAGVALNMTLSNG